MYVDIMLMVIMIDITGRLIEYTTYFGNLHVSAVMLSNFWQKYVMWSYEYVCIMYIEIMHARMFESKIWSIIISVCSMFLHGYVQEWKG